jgi:hypothetical protein
MRKWTEKDDKGVRRYWGFTWTVQNWNPDIGKLILSQQWSGFDGASTIELSKCGLPNANSSPLRNFVRNRNLCVGK